MMNTANFTVRMDADVKSQSESIFNALGINLTTAINVFLRKAIQANGFPFDVRLDMPNKETLDAIREAEMISAHIRSGKRKPYSSWKAAKTSLLK